jgi:hypothetical protein
MALRANFFRGWVSWGIPSFIDLLAIILFANVFFHFSPVKEFDLFWHIKTGELMLQNHQLFYTDPYSFTHLGVDWINHEWLSQIIFAILYKIGNLPLIAFMNALIIGLLIYQWFGRLLKAKISVFMCLAVSFFVFLTTSAVWTPRPHLFSLLLFSTTLLVLQRYRRSQKAKAWWLPLIVILWVNLHSGFITGLVLLLLFNLSEGIKLLFNLSNRMQPLRYKHIVLISIICLLVSFLTPYGVDALFYPFQYLSGHLPSEQYVNEWVGSNFHHAPLFVIYLLALFFSLGFSRKEKDMTQMIISLPFMFLALKSVRHIPFFVMTSLVLFGTHFSLALHEWNNYLIKKNIRLIQPLIKSLRKFFINESPKFLMLEQHLNKRLVFTIFAVGCLAYGLFNPAKFALDSSKLPIDAVEFLKTQPRLLESKGLNEYAWGGYLIGQLYPQTKVFIDGRNDVHPTAFLEEYREAVNALPGYEKVLDKYEIGWTLLQTGAPLNQLLAGQWRRVYSDPVATIYSRI